MQTQITGTEKPSILVQNLVVRPANRKSQDINSWRNAMRSAEASNPRRVELYDLYEDILLDGHLDSIIEKRIMAVTNADWQFMKDGKIIDRVNDLIDTTEFEDLLAGIINPRFWGYSMMEFIFRKDGSFSIFDVPKKNMRPETGIVAYEQTGDAGINIREGIYLNTVLEVGKPKDLGKLLKAAQYAIYKRGDFGDWAQFAELFGMPFRVGTYDGYDDAQRVKLEKALDEMGGAAHVVIPEGTNIDFKENKTNSDGALYKNLKDACNAEMSKLILGQTMTTENGSSLSQSKTHKEVEEELNKSDLIFTRRILNSKFIKILEANGVKTEGGWFNIPGLGEEKLTTKERVDLVIRLKEAGLPVDDDYLYEEFGIPKPANYKELKEASKTAVTVLENAPEKKVQQKKEKPVAKEKEEETKLSEDGENITKKLKEITESYLQRLGSFFG